MHQITSVKNPDSGVVSTVLPCTLDRSTQNLIKLIFDTDMFNKALKDLEIGWYDMCLLTTRCCRLHRGGGGCVWG